MSSGCQRASPRPPWQFRSPCHHNRNGKASAGRGGASFLSMPRELVGEYFDARVTLFTLVFVIVATVEAGFFFYQLRLKRQITRVKVKAATTVREVANETTALLARLNEHDLERELWLSITEAMKKT